MCPNKFKEKFILITYEQQANKALNYWRHLLHLVVKMSPQSFYLNMFKLKITNDRTNIASDFVKDDFDK